jgi:cAMP-dependent protein kinase regulator
MEVTVVETGDLPANTVISFHTGSIRRHALVEKNKAINLSYVTGSEPIRVDLMSQIGSHTFDMVPGQDVYDVPINSAEASSNDVKLKFQIRDAAAAADARAKKAAEQTPGQTDNDGFDSQSPVSPSRKLQTALMMRSYLDNHDVLRQMQELLQDMVTNRPEDPIDYMIKRLEVVCEDSQDVEIENLDGNSSRIIMADVDVRVYGMPASSNTMGPVLLAMDAGIGGIELCNIMEGAHKKPEFVAMNPFTHVPTLKDGDFCIGESGANLRYIAMKYKPSYYPVNDPVTCAWIDFSVDSFSGDVYPAWSDIVYPVMGIRADPSDWSKAKQELTEKLDTWVKVFLKTKFVCGDRISIADFKAGPYLFACAQPGVEKKTGFKPSDRVRQYVEDFCLATKSSSLLKSAGGFSIAEFIAGKVPDAGSMSSFTKTSLAAATSLGKASGKVKIYGMSVSSNSMSAVLLAMDAGVGEIEATDLMKGQHMTPEFLAMNPFHHLPTLKDGDFSIGESNAILRYLAIKYKPAYYPLHDQQICSTIDFAMDTFSGDVYPKWANIVYPVMGIRAFPEDKSKACEELTAILETWTKKFLQGKFVCGEKVSIADFKIGPFFFACCQPGVETQTGFKPSERVKKFAEDFCAASSSTSMLKSAGGSSIAEFIASKVGSPAPESTRQPSKDKAKDDESEEEDDDHDDVDDLPPPPAAYQSGKQRQSVSAEAYGAFNQREAFQKKIVPKNDEQKARIREVLSHSWMFKSHNDDSISTIVDAMTEKIVEKDVRIVQQGEDGNVMWVIEEGILECSKVFGPDEEKVVKVCKHGDIFGELALLYSCPRAASVTSRDKCVLWELDRETFKAVCTDGAMDVSYEGFNAPGKPAKEEAQEEEDDHDEINEPPPVQKQSTGKRREGVSAEAMKDDGEEWVPPVHPKSDEERKQVSDIIKTSHDSKLHMLFGTVNAATFEKILDAVFLKKYQPGEHAIEQGAVGDFFYIVKSGKFDIIVKKGDEPAKKVFEAEQGFAFGELALLYNAPRTATITATAPSDVWCLDRAAFRNLVVRSSEAQFKEYVQFLGGVDVFQVLSDTERASLAEVFEEEEFEEDEAIVEQGERDDKMFILRKGNAVACIKGDKGEVEVKQYSVGDYFGEIALLSGEPRKASVYAVGPVTCLYITRETFLRILGPLKHLLERNMSSYAKYQDAITNAEPDATQGEAGQQRRHSVDEEEFVGGVNLQGKTKTKIAKKRERKAEDLSGITAKAGAFEKADDEPNSLADKVAQDFKNTALVEPSVEFKIPESQFWVYGGLILGQKFT